MRMLSRELRFFPGRKKKYDLLKIAVKNFIHAIHHPIQPPAARLTLPPRSNPGIQASYLGHATVFISCHGTYLLTDPNFASWIKMARRTVGLPILPREIKALDMILISHAHFDHLDLPSLKQLPREALLIIPRGCRDLVEALGFSRVVELGWSEKYIHHDTSILAFPPAHWGQRSPWDDQKRWYNSYIIKKNNQALLFAGDTGYSKSFAGASCEGKISLAFFPITAYEPAWFRLNHASPEEALRMFQECGAQYMIPIHWGTFILSLEPPEEPLKRIRAEARRLKLDDRVIVLKHGETFTIPE